MEISGFGFADSGLLMIAEFDSEWFGRIRSNFKLELQMVAWLDGLWILNSIMISNLSAQQLRQAASIKDRIDELQTELENLLGESTPAVAAVGSVRRKMSASARAKIGAAQKARWARVNGNGAAKPTKTQRRKMSPAARAKIAAAARARWAKVKAVGKKSL
jgi:hypothetical protein